MAADADGLSLGTAPHVASEFSLSGHTGDYRRLLHKLDGLAWRVLQYSNRDEPLARTDLVGDMTAVQRTGVHIHSMGQLHSNEIAALRPAITLLRDTVDKSDAMLAAQSQQLKLDCLEVSHCGCSCSGKYVG